MLDIIYYLTSPRHYQWHGTLLFNIFVLIITQVKVSNPLVAADMLKMNDFRPGAI
jgi:hypothetical protein